MALRKRTGSRFESNIWAGFVDATTALLLVMIFVLSIFMIIQFFMRETIIGQGRELDTLSGQLAQLSEALGATRKQNDELQGQNQTLEDRLAQLQFDYDQQQSAIASFEEQIASLLARSRDLEAQIEAEKSANAALLDERDAAALALAQLRNETDLKAEEARLAAAKAEALEQMIAEMQQETTPDTGALEASIAEVLALAQQAGTDEAIAGSALGQELQDEVAKLTELEQQRLAEQAATRYLRERLKNSEDEITAMTLALEEERRRAEETLTLLAALDNSRTEVEASDLSEDEKNAALLKIAQEEIALREKESEENARRIALLNQQAAQLRGQLQALQGLLDAAAEADAAANVQIEALGSSLNAALARVAAEERRRANDLENYRSEFFGRLRQLLEDVEGIEVVGDRFLLSSEVLFPAGSAQLSSGGQAQISQIAQLINDISQNIPPELNWILRVDGHTDTTPVSAANRYADNWELSQARALSVVRFMIENEGVDASRLAATGFGEYHPVSAGTDPEALARNRRIELKLTEQ